MINYIKSTSLQILYPRTCPVCRKILVKRELPQKTIHTNNTDTVFNMYICKYCIDKLIFAEDPACFKCGRPLINENEELCADCKRQKRAFDKGIPLLIHNDDSRKIIYDMKYGGIKDNADFLGREIALKSGSAILSMNIDAMIPVPLHKKREFERGFNQAELLARKIYENLIDIYGHSPDIDSTLLIRQGKTKRQKNLNHKERAENVKGKFSINPDGIYIRDNSGNIIYDAEGIPYYKDYYNVLLIDDIFTSGATLNECAATLKQAGVKEVCFLTATIVA